MYGQKTMRVIVGSVIIVAFLAAGMKAAFAQIIPAQNQVTATPYGGLVYSTSSIQTAKLYQLRGSAYGDTVIWNGSIWTTTGTSSLGLVTSVSNSDGTLTISPTVGAVIASINLAHVNNWSALQTFSNASTSLFTVSGTQWITSLGTPAGAVLAVDPNGKLIATTTAQGTVTSVAAATPNSSLTLGGTNPITTSGTINFDLNLAHSNFWTALQNFTNASTSQLTATSSVWFTSLATPAGTILAVDPNGKLIATTTAASGVTSVTATYPVTSTGGATPNIALAFGTTTANIWSALQTFANSSTTLATISNLWTGLNPFNLLATDATGKMVATSTISTGFLTGPLGTINTSAPLGGGGAFNIGTTLTLTCATCITSPFPTSTNPLMATYFVATSTTLASQFPYASTTAFSFTATSTGTNGINLSAGCFAISGTCVPQNSGIILSSTYSTSTVGTTTIQFTGAAGSAATFSAGVLTLPSNTTYITMDVMGAGGGGGEGGTGVASGAAGVTGKQSCFGTSSTAVCVSPLLQSPAGTGGFGGVDVSAGGAGGSGGGLGVGTLTSSTTWAGMPGGTGSFSTGGNGRGGSGGGYGGGTIGANATPNAGAGGSGGAGAAGSGGGAGGGGTLSKGVITTLAANYYFSNGAGGAGGSGGGGTDGGAGASGAFTIYVYVPTGTAVGSTIGSGTTGQFPYYAAAGTSLTATSTIFLDTTGFIGIGTTSPWTSFVVRAPGIAKSSASIGPWVSNGDYLAVYLNGLQGANNYNFISSPTDTNLHINRPTGSRIDFLENNVAQAGLATGGNFGIGTVFPNAKLTVIASSTVAQAPGTGAFTISDAVSPTEIFDLGYDPNLNAAFMQASNSTFQPLLLNPRGGNVGIGTTTPLSKLTVNGDIGTDGTNITVSGCGTGPAVTKGSTDTAGEVTEGTIATGCTISFSSTKTNAPFCTASSESGLAFSFSQSTTALTVVNIGALSSTKIDYICIANNK